MATEPAELRWETFKLFGAEDRQNDVLVQVVAPALAAAQADGAAGAWFFQRYLDGPGHRPHLRVRVTGDADTFARHLDAAAKDARAAGDLVSVERAPYFPETARLGGRDAHTAVHALFEGASELALSLLEVPDPSTECPGDSAVALARPGDDLPAEVMGGLWLVAAFDRLARAFGLDVTRHWWPPSRGPEAHADVMTADLEAELSRELRACRPALRSLLAGDEADTSANTADESSAGVALARYAEVARKALAAISDPQRERLLPALLHLDAVRLLGPDRLAELRAYVLWERGLESLWHHPAKSQGRPRPPAKAPTRPDNRGAPGSPALPGPTSQRSVNAPHRSRRRSSPAP